MVNQLTLCRTSHEMRNPLGATMQCADDIVRMIENEKTLCKHEGFRALFDPIRENAKTIAFCSAHQKTIADDILVVSKLSSSLLSLSPAVCQPEMVARQVVRMFQAEAANAEISLDLGIHQSYAISWALCDASRIRQVLINLVSNSIKFTKGRTRRQIRVTIGSSNAAPPGHMSELHWHPKESPAPVLGDTSNTFLTFQVQDTGKGLTPEEMSRLFNRFSQANSTTSAVYGGSGLGLFISMQLAELQGGRIGLTSKSEEGSK
jgi:signal transduction histidine kinase